jgi:Holliday junction resolvasome RuvABC endonuclease subunit
VTMTNTHNIPVTTPLSQSQPWAALGMSRATWYRRGKPTTADRREKPTLDDALAIVKAAGYRISKPRTPRPKTPKRKNQVGPTYACTFADGETVRMSVCTPLEVESLDWSRGERLAQAAYLSRWRTRARAQYRKLNGQPCPVDLIAIPILGGAAKTRVDAIGLRNWIETHHPDIAGVERAGSMPRQGVASAFKYGRAAGTIEAIIACLGIPMVLVEPSKWKRTFHLNSDKEAARQLAIGLFPHAHDRLSLKRHHQRAEAMLVALFTANKPVLGVLSKATLATEVV